MFWWCLFLLAFASSSVFDSCFDCVKSVGDGFALCGCTGSCVSVDPNDGSFACPLDVVDNRFAGSGLVHNVTGTNGFCGLVSGGDDCVLDFSNSGSTTMFSLTPANVLVASGSSTVAQADTVYTVTANSVAVRGRIRLEPGSDLTLVSTGGPIVITGSIVSTGQSTTVRLSSTVAVVVSGAIHAANVFVSAPSIELDASISSSSQFSQNRCGIFASGLCPCATEQTSCNGQHAGTANSNYGFGSCLAPSTCGSANIINGTVVGLGGGVISMGDDATNVVLRNGPTVSANGGGVGAGGGSVSLTAKDLLIDGGSVFPRFEARGADGAGAGGGGGGRLYLRSDSALLDESAFAVVDVAGGAGSPPGGFGTRTFAHFNVVENQVQETVILETPDDRPLSSTFVDLNDFQPTVSFELRGQAVLNVCTGDGQRTVRSIVLADSGNSKPVVGCFCPDSVPSPFLAYACSPGPLLFGENKNVTKLRSMLSQLTSLSPAAVTSRLKTINQLQLPNFVGPSAAFVTDSNIIVNFFLVDTEFSLVSKHFIDLYISSPDSAAGSVYLECTDPSCSVILTGSLAAASVDDIAVSQIRVLSKGNFTVSGYVRASKATGRLHADNVGRFAAKSVFSLGPLVNLTSGDGMVFGLESVVRAEWSAGDLAAPPSFACATNSLSSLFPVHFASTSTSSAVVALKSEAGGLLLQGGQIEAVQGTVLVSSSASSLLGFGTIQGHAILVDDGPSSSVSCEILLQTTVAPGARNCSSGVVCFAGQTPACRAVDRQFGLGSVVACQADAPPPASSTVSLAAAADDCAVLAIPNLSPQLTALSIYFAVEEGPMESVQARLGTLEGIRAGRLAESIDLIEALAMGPGTASQDATVHSNRTVRVARPPGAPLVIRLDSSGSGSGSSTLVSVSVTPFACAIGYHVTNCSSISTNGGCRRCDRGYFSATGTTTTDSVFFGQLSASAVARFNGNSTTAKTCLPCPVNTWMPPNSIGIVGNCLTCNPESMACAGAGQLPVPRPGYWASNYTDTFFQCTKTAYCPGGDYNQCLRGRQGVACAFCDVPQFFSFKNDCIECPDDAAARMSIFLAVAGLLLVAALVFSSRIPGRGLIMSMVVHLQTMSIFFSIDLSWSPRLLQLFKFLDFFALSIDPASPECVLGELSYDMLWYFYIGVPVVFGLVALIIHKLCVFQKCKNLAVHGFFMLILIGYILYSRLLFEVYDCSEQTSSQQETVYSLDAFPAILCHPEDTKWLPLAILSPLFILCYLVLVPIFLCRKIAQAPDLDENSQLSRWGWLYDGYRYQSKRIYAYWKLVITFRKGLLVLVVLFTSSRPLIQGALALSVIFIGLLLQVVFRPAESWFLNAFEAFSLGSQVVILGMALFFDVSGMDSPDNQFTLTLLVSSLFAVSCLLFLVFFVLEFCKRRKKKKRSRSDSSSRRSRSGSSTSLKKRKRRKSLR